MPKPDLILLHAPSVYDFRERPAIYGPISDVIPSTPIFEMYPLGFVSMVGYLEQQGYHARIINLAVKMLRNPSLDVEKLVSELNAQAFGLDLHWLAHAAGSLDIAEIVKRHHPDTPVILGGLSASYFHDEIIQRFPQVDYVLRGDTTEKPLLELMGCIERGLEPEEVENLTWRDPDGRKRINPLSFVPEYIDDLWTDYGEVIKLVVRHRDLESTLPFENFMDYPFTALHTCKGCNYDCVTCGGSSSAFSRFFNRERTAFKTPERLVEEMRVVSEYFKAPIFLIGDLRQAGRKRAEEALDLIRREGFDNTITYELFDTVPEDYMSKLAKSADSWTLEISPESHDDRLRGIMGKPYITAEMEKTIGKALEHGCGKFDVYFMVGLSEQSSESALESVEYCRRLYEKMQRDSKIFTFIAPMAPFLDPGSKVYEDPGEYGYSKLYRTLREHKKALYQPSWKHYLSYYTDWMTRDEIAETTYEAMIRMNKLKAEIGVTDPRRAEQITSGLSLARDIMRSIDDILASTSDESERSLKYEQLRWEIEEAKKSTDFAKRELRMPGTVGIRLKGVLKYLLRRAGLIH
ncbi:MAG: TIGR04190 family B12-binding domain/radical SAM domain protein [Candidatus Bathyarchaeia archaeon]